MDSQSLLQELGNRLGIEMEYDDNGSASVGFDSEEVEFIPSAGGVLLMSEIASSYGKEGLCSVLLAANMPGGEGRGCTISLDREFECFLLHRQLPPDMSYEAFEKALVGFIVALRDMKRKCSGTDGSGSEEVKSFTVLDFMNAIRG